MSLEEFQKQTREAMINPTPLKYLSKKKPHYLLDTIKQLIRKPETRIITKKASATADSLGFGLEEILDCIEQLTPEDFYKSMTCESDNSLWQDVYYTYFEGYELYVKIQISKIGNGVVISFKENDNSG